MNNNSYYPRQQNIADNKLLLDVPGGTGAVEQVIFFGTGTSGCVPSVHCLTADEPNCKVCLSAINDPASRNFRLNTSAMMRCRGTPSETLLNILIDCGKTFYNQAIAWCGAYRLRRLDAVFLTHAHADAVRSLLTSLSAVADVWIGRFATMDAQ
jgi:glyoxylase-like metal-dependent hydrolase (beta-lactamase superfamily II)